MAGIKCLFCRCSPLCLAALFLTLAIGCGGHAKPSPGSVDTGTFTYGNPELKVLFEQFDSAARRTAGSGWMHEPYRNTHAPNGFWYKADWSERELAWDERGFLTPPNHYVQVNASPGVPAADPLRIRQVVVSGATMPREGWGARCDFTTEGPAETDSLQFTLYDCRQGGAGGERLELSGAGCVGTVTFDGFSYRFRASVPPVQGEAAVPVFLESADSFLNAAVAEQDRLEAAVRNSHAQGTLINLITPVGWSSRDGAPQEPQHPLSDAQQEQVLQAALASVESQRASIRRHFSQFHTAASAAFPLLDCLQASGRTPRNSPAQVAK